MIFNIYNDDFKPANGMFKPIKETLLESIFDSFEQKYTVTKSGASSFNY